MSSLARGTCTSPVDPFVMRAIGCCNTRRGSCRFSGVRPVAGFGFGAAAAAVSAAAPSAADPVELSAQLDGDLAQCLRHMSKRDTTTKMKALQASFSGVLPVGCTAGLCSSCSNC